MTKANILLVEDDIHLSELFQHILTSKDFSVFSELNGELGLKRAKEEQIDLIITDYMMPVMNGIDMVKEIKAIENLRGIPVIMMTAVGESENHINALKAGVDKFLTKPIKAAVLVAEAENSVNNKQVKDQLISKFMEKTEELSNDVLNPLKESDGILSDVISKVGNMKTDSSVTARKMSEIVELLFSNKESSLKSIDNAMKQLSVLKMINNNKKNSKPIDPKLNNLTEDQLFSLINKTLTNIKKDYKSHMSLFNDLIYNLQLHDILTQQSKHMEFMVGKLKKFMKNVLSYYGEVVKPDITENIEAEPTDFNINAKFVDDGKKIMSQDDIDSLFD